MESSNDYGYSVEVTEGYDEAVIRARLALRAEGFSILTEAHVGEVLDPSVPYGRQYLIMSAWSPTVAHRDVAATPPRGPAEPAPSSRGPAEPAPPSRGPAEPAPRVEVAVHLPCNFVVQETGGSALVAALDPAEGSSGQGEGETELAMDAREALGRVLARIVDQ
jgi:uncharacterized protein (DUF302 family)